MTSDKIKVLYIAATSRSGTTITSNLLGQLDGFFSGSELVNMWRALTFDNTFCACGAHYPDCSFWRAVFEEAFGGFDKVNPEELVTQRHTARISARRAAMRRRPWSPPIPEIEKYVETVGKFYHALHKISGCRVIVDSSKGIPYGYILQQLPFIELYIMHQVRDPRGLALSQLQTLETTNPQYGAAGAMKALVLSAYRSMRRNAAIEWIWNRHSARYLRVRYEDLIADLVPTLHRVVSFVKEDPALVDDLRFTGHQTVHFDPAHCVSGNRSRRQRGDVTLRINDEWKTKLGAREKLITTVLTLPVMLRYNYPLSDSS